MKSCYIESLSANFRRLCTSLAFFEPYKFPVVFGDDMVVCMISLRRCGLYLAMNQHKTVEYINRSLACDGDVLLGILVVSKDV